MSNTKPEKPETIVAIAKPDAAQAPPNLTQSFVPELDAVAMSEFIFAGVAYAQYAPFPHKALNVDKMTLNGLWLAGIVRFVTGTDKSTVQAGEIDALAAKLALGKPDGETDAGFDAALARLVEIAKGNARVVAPPPPVYKEDPEDEPDPAELEKMKAAVRATVPKAPKQAKPPAAQ